MHRRDLFEVLGAAAAIPFLRPLSPDARLRLARGLHNRLGRGQPLQALDAHQNVLVSELAETIIPRTDTPGAKDVRVNEFVDLILAEWHSPEERERFLGGLDALEARCRERHGNGFAALDQARRSAFLTELDGAPGESGSPEATFRRLKELTVYGFFTSKAVTTDVLHYEVIPGRFDGCAPFEAG